jgi:glycosyltransferase involved in cell wall biosynthesis
MGGGERYLFSLAGALAESHDVVMAGPALPDRAALASFGLPTTMPMVEMPTTAFTAASRRYHTTAYLTNYFPRPSLAGRRLVVAQFPFRALARTPRRVLEEAALARSQVIVYSQFARQWVRHRWHRDATVVPPAVALGNYHPDAKQKLILAVGRFFAGEGNLKRQDVLIEAFAALPRATRRRWRLVLAGGAGPDSGTRAYLDQLQDMARGLPVDIVPNVSCRCLGELYSEAALFWHAAGFGRPDNEPERAEHFGMTTVEAMSHGVVPLVHRDGGQPETVDPSVGWLWRSEDELLAATEEAIEDAPERARRAAAAHRASRRFGEEAFRSAVRRLLRS